MLASTLNLSMCVSKDLEWLCNHFVMSGLFLEFSEVKGVKNLSLMMLSVML